MDWNTGLSMGTTNTRITLGTILLLLLCFPYLSISDAIYRPNDLLSINCGSSNNLSTPDGRNWTAGIKFLTAESLDSVAAPPNIPSTIMGPYTSARLSHSQFSYSFPVTAGPKFLRLFFYSTSYQNFDRSKAYFSVKVGPYIYTLLQDFNTSLNADADDDPGQPDILFREYCINIRDHERLDIAFIPTITAQHQDSYAFINGIEIVSMPPYLYYTNPDVDSAGLPQLVGLERPFPIETNSALETMYRLRTTPNYTAPDQVYRSLRNMGPDGSFNMGFNLTWKLPVDSGFTYLLRLPFCQIDPHVLQAGDLEFYIFIADQLATDKADVLLWANNEKGVPVVRDYAISILGNREKVNLSLKMHPHPRSLIKNTQLNAIELFKIHDPTGNLAGPKPNLPFLVPHESSNKKSNGTMKTLAAVAGAVSSVVLLSFIITFFLIKRRKNILVNKDSNNKEKGSNKKEGTSRGSGSLSLPMDLYRQFSITEMRDAMNNFDEVFVVGMGGFGNVYKGHIDNCSTTVAIKRLKPGSRQGIREFKNEIEMLSQLRHPNVVSLIGYCYESNEMIVVYEFMDRGNLHDHIYDTDNLSLSWKHRLQVCIGVARGLHYLHTGEKQVIIHRDVKSANILLDEKWEVEVSDFGLSRIGGPTGISMMTSVNTEVKGSIGYLDPEYYKRNILTEKSDVYSFGVMLLEVLSGRHPLLRWEEKQRMSLVNWAKHCYENGTLSEIVDSELKGQIAPQCLDKFGEVALSCLLEDGTHRPSMNDVVGGLEFVLQFRNSAINYEDSSGHSTLPVSD
uniref:Protein kinase domain-containing protein n=1 Tax=Glycine max TaxID=3847 RepID=A0A0R0IXG3_SOYBN